MPTTNLDLRTRLIWRFLVPLLISAAAFCGLVSFAYHDLRGFLAAMIH
jgi:hypothetical protein